MYLSYKSIREFSILKGKTISTVIVSDDDEQITFHCADGSKFIMAHDQDCCENVAVEDITGSWDDIVGFPVLLAESVSLEDGEIPGKSNDEYGGSYTWTFYKIATKRGRVTIRWYGESNGYYSEEVNLYQTE